MSTACQDGDHLYVMVYSRPWRRAFRKTVFLCCWNCDLRVIDPLWREEG